MKKRVYTEYIAEDGTVFHNRRDCEEYERKDKNLYRVIYRTTLQYYDEVWADNEEQAKRMVLQISPNYDEWTEESTDVKCYQLQNLNEIFT